ncbi:hypothetical protein COD94_17820 [Bacillus cereus]|nr:hypothetical protein COD94_17820 [Bacillus cereus]
MKSEIFCYRISISELPICGAILTLALIQKWGELGALLFWLPWGVAFGLATIAYYQRRRGQCKYCRRL